MKQTINFSQFCDAFSDMDRFDTFGYHGLRVLFDYLKEYEEESGEEIELDVIALCCDYSMMTYEEIEREYQLTIIYDDAVSEEDIDCLRKDAVISYLGYNTCIVGEVGSDSVIFQCF